MTNPDFFNTVHIQNFKSLKDVTLSDCKRINLLIGKPNVGKSNILEAIGLFSFPHIDYYSNNPDEKTLSKLIRLENIGELFFDGNVEYNISIEANMKLFCTIEYVKKYHSYALMKMGGERFGFDSLNSENDIGHVIVDMNENLSFINSPKDSIKGYPVNLANISSTIKYYKFSSDFFQGKQSGFFSQDYLIPPYGINIVDVFRKSVNLKTEFSELFEEYKLKLFFDKGMNSLRVFKYTPDGEIFSIPYSSIADTLQRVIFFKTAIASNKDSILLFEEPEAHCFPPYIKHIAQEIIDSETNQFFIATHSPFILDTFLEDSRNDLAIFMADFRDGQTMIKRLTDEEVNDVYEYGLDLFFNSDLFTDEI